MTSFAQLEKRANSLAHQRPSGLVNPYAPQAAAAVKQPSKWWGRAEGAMDVATGLAGMIPVAGGLINGAWQGGKSLYHLAKGNKGKAAEAAAWAAAGFIPGAALGKTVGKAALGAGRMARASAGLARATAPITNAAVAGKAAVGGTNFGRQAIRAGQAVAASRPGGAALGVIKAAPGRTGLGVLGAGTAAGAGVVPGLSNAATPAAAPPTAPLDPYQSLSHMTAATIANGGPLQQ